MATKKAAKTTKPTRKLVKRVAKKTAPRKAAKKAAASAKEEKPAFDPSVHVLVPKHEVLSEKEIQALYEQYDLQPIHLPTIYVSDPALRGLQVKMGDIIRITRPSPTAGTSIFYRRVAYE